MLSALAFVNTLLAAATLIVFVRLAWRAKTIARFIYLAACVQMLYIMAVYGHLFFTGYSLGIEYTRPATGFFIVILFAVGVYDLLRD